jgi:hypothetical protein
MVRFIRLGDLIGMVETGPVIRVAPLWQAGLFIFHVANLAEGTLSGG